MMAKQDDEPKGKSEQCIGEHLVVLTPPDERGNNLVLRHTADHRTEPGFARCVRQGEDLRGKRLLHARPIEGCPGRLAIKEFRVDDLTSASPVDAPAGPAMVATDAYRDGWDRIFGGRAERGQA
jgi:hypothetical protein